MEPMVPTPVGPPWRSMGSEEEILLSKAREGRPLIRIHFTRARRFFMERQNQLKLSSREALEAITEVRPMRDPNYELLRIEHEMGVQAVTSTEARATQTAWYRRVESAVQVQAERENLDGLEEAAEEAERDPQLYDFLETVTPRVVHNLVQNTEVPIYCDTYGDLTEEDALFANKEDSLLKEHQSFVHHQFTKGKRIVCIDWQPKTSRVVAVAVQEPLTFEQRLAANRRVLTTLVIVWSFSDPIHPQFVLEAPTEMNVVRFHPQLGHLIAGGCSNGQVCLWNIAKAQESVRSRMSKKSVGGARSGQKMEYRDEMGDDRDDMRLKWSQISKIESSHRRGVNDVCWLPDGIECGFDGKARPFPCGNAGRNGGSWGRQAFPSPDGMTHQFATISSDGYLFVWDFRKDNLRKDRLRKLQQQASKSITRDLPWVPLLRVWLEKLDGTGAVPGLRMFLESRFVDMYRMCCGSEEGDFISVNWAPIEEKRADEYAEYGGERHETRSHVIEQHKGHFNAANSVQRHPSREELSDIYITAGDWSFLVWKLGTDAPLFSSPCMPAPVTCARWSPTRPSVVFVGTGDGFLQIWDLLERGHEPILTQQVSQSPVTYMEFKSHPPESRQRFTSQLLAVGDESGVLHVFELPRVLIKPPPHELKNMAKYLERELKRAIFFQQRWRVRRKELDELRARQQAEKIERELEQKAPGVDEEAAEEENEFANDDAFRRAKDEFETLLKGEDEEE